MGLFTTNFINSLINNFFNFLRKIKFKSLYGFSLYELFRLYLTGLLKGSITTRAGSISFSFFMAASLSAIIFSNSAKRVDDFNKSAFNLFHLSCSAAIAFCLASNSANNSRFFLILASKASLLSFSNAS